MWKWALAAWIAATAISASLAANATFDGVRRAVEQCQWAGGVLEAGAGLLLGALTVWLARKTVTTYVDHRLVGQLIKGNVPAVDVLVLPVSNPGRDESSEFGKKGPDSDWPMLQNALAFAEGTRQFAEGTRHEGWGVNGVGTPPVVKYEDWRSLAGFGDPRLWLIKNENDHRFRSFTWQTGFRTVDAFLGHRDGRLAIIHLVPSTTSGGEGTESVCRRYYKPMLKALIEERFTKALSGRVVHALDEGDVDRSTRPAANVLQIIAHDGVDYEDFDAVQDKLRCIVDTEKVRFGDDVSIDFDVTGGTAAFSTVAAIEATRPDVFYSHVSQKLDAGINVFEVVAEVRA